MPHRLAHYATDAVLYVIAGISGTVAAVRGVWAQAGPPAANPDAAISGGTLAAVVVAAITASTPLILRAVDLVRAKEAIRQYRHYARNLEQRLDLSDSENRMLRDALVRASRKHDFDLPDWFYDDPEPAPTRPSGPILPPVVTPDPAPEDRP